MRFPVGRGGEGSSEVVVYGGQLIYSRGLYMGKLEEMFDI